MLEKCEKSKPKSDISQLSLTTNSVLKTNQVNDIRHFYQLGRRIGTGINSEVRICTKRATGVKRAVKIIRKDMMTQKEKNSLFEEVKSLSRLEHPSVIKLYEVYQDSKRFYVISDLLQGHKVLANVTMRHAFFERDAVPFM